MQLSQALKQKWPDYAKRLHDKVTAQQHSVTCCESGQGNVRSAYHNWVILLHPQYSPDIAPSDYYFVDKIVIGRSNVYKSSILIKIPKMGRFVDSLKRYRSFNVESYYQKDEKN